MKETVTIERSVKVKNTPRVAQMRGMFDLHPEEESKQTWQVDLDIDNFDWNIGLIVGPSGSGKSTIANELFPGLVVTEWEWDHDKSVLDSFPKSMGIRDIVKLLSSVGFSSPPSWVRPYRVLSTGEKFRVDVARSLAEMPDLAVIDEFTSVVDRTVAQIGSAAVAKSVRGSNSRLIAVSCHHDIIPWLDPDWVYDPVANVLERRSVRQGRPPITLEVCRVYHSSWRLFSKHHYLDEHLHKAARCFVAFMPDGTPVAFDAWLPSPGHKNSYRETRVVCLPDYQGIGIGRFISEFCASMVAGMGYKAMSTMAHPTVVHSRASSPNWKLVRPPSMTKQGAGLYKETGLGKQAARTRLTAGFLYTGPAMERKQAEALWNSEPTK